MRRSGRRKRALYRKIVADFIRTVSVGVGVRENPLCRIAKRRQKKYNSALKSLPAANMNIAHPIFYSFHEAEEHIGQNRPLRLPREQWTGYLKRLHAHGDFVGFIDPQGAVFQIFYEGFSGCYWCELAAPEHNGSYGAFQTPVQARRLLESLPDAFTPETLPELSFEPWYEHFDDTPYGREADSLYHQSCESGELVRAAEDVCESCVSGDWDKMCDDHLLLLQRVLLAVPEAYTPVNFLRLQNALQWLDELVENNDAFEESCMDNCCDMLLERVVDYHNYRQPRH